MPIDPQLRTLISLLRAALLSGVALFATGASQAAGAADPSTLPLVQETDITYLGGFALPSWANGPTGTSYFEYGGHALTPYTDPSTGKATLFMEGHAQHPGNVAQIQVPDTIVNSGTLSALPMAKVLQPFADITDGHLAQVDPTDPVNPIFVYGLLPYKGKLIVGASNSYSASQTVSHGVSGMVLANKTDFTGWYTLQAAAPVRALGGPMAPIPAEWQAAFGGTAMTGNCCISITGSTSAGMSATVFDPAVFDPNKLPASGSGTTVLFYPLAHPQCGSFQCESSQSSNYNLTTQYGGMVFVPGTRTVLFVGATGTGPYCYNSATVCNDPALPDVKGPHGPPYRYQVWAYDANELLAVKNGTKQSWEPKPYGIWVLNGMPNSGDDRIRGAGYDVTTGRLYIAQGYGEEPRIEVYQINVGTRGTPPHPLPNPPSNVTVQ
jgi:hypothetical protein